jgi:hypothetical protein
MRRKFFVTFGFLFSLHFIKRIAPGPICVRSLPARYALGVGERCGEWLANEWHTIPPLRVRPHQQPAL